MKCGKCREIEEVEQSKCNDCGETVNDPWVTFLLIIVFLFGVAVTITMFLYPPQEMGL